MVERFPEEEDVASSNLALGTERSDRPDRKQWVLLPVRICARHCFIYKTRSTLVVRLSIFSRMLSKKKYNRGYCFCKKRVLALGRVMVIMDL